MNKVWAFEAMDTFFFRGGTPFRQGEGGAVQPESFFPPTMLTLQGAIRAQLARQQGWTPANPHLWPNELGTESTVPGELDDLGVLRLAGPYLYYKGEYLYPAPSILFGKEKKGAGWKLTYLLPQMNRKINSDLGEITLLQPKHAVEKGKALSVWLTRTGLEKVLAGGIPEQKEIYSPSNLWDSERRVGIERQLETRTAEDHHLYALTFIRPRLGLQVVVEVGGIPISWHPIKREILPLGGEGRAAKVVVRDEELQLPVMPKLEAKDGWIHYTVTLLTPGWFITPEKVVREGPPEIPGDLISASIGKVMRVGGWDLKNRAPRPLRPLLPPGTTWFYRAKEQDRKQIESLHGTWVGENTSYGMGQIVIGRWEAERCAE